MRMLIIGGSGRLGRRLAARAVVDGDQIVVTYRTHRPRLAGATDHPLDLRERAQIEQLVDQIEPDVIINAAFQQNDWPSTAVGPANLARVVADRPIRLVHVSSDAVFSGKAIRYDETAMPDPVTPYGAAKAAAETAVAAINPEALIARTSLIIGHGESTVERLTHAMASGGSGTLFSDDVRCPVHVDDLAAALLELGRGQRSGIHHVAGAEPISRHALGVLIARRDGLSIDLRSGRRADAGIPGPIDVRLDSTLTQRHLHTRLRGVSEFLGKS